MRKKKHFTIGSQDFMKKTKFKKNIQNTTYKPDTCLNSGELFETDDKVFLSLLRFTILRRFTVGPMHGDPLFR